MNDKSYNTLGVNQFIDDRHADNLVARFVTLTEGFIIEGLDLSAMFRQPFYLNCLRTDDYMKSSGLSPQRILLIAGTRISVNGSGWIYVRESNSPREDTHVLPVIEALKRKSIKSGSASIKSDSRLKIIRQGLYSIVFQRDVTTFFREHVGIVKRYAQQLQNELQLDEKFINWFITSSFRFYMLYRNTLRYMRLIRSNIDGFLVYSEYQRAARAFLSVAKELDIPTVLIMHGFLGQEWLHYPILSDRTCLWGDVDFHWYKERGVNEDILKVTGSHLAGRIDLGYRTEVRHKYNLDAGQLAIIYFAPNTLDHIRQKGLAAIMALREVTSDSKYRWFSRPHPSQPETGKLFVENGFEDIPASISVEEAYALADVIIHDYSSMEFSEYSGIVTLCLPADPPYPDYYKPLLGDQQIIKTPEHFLEIIRDIEPGYKPGAGVTKAMAAEGEDALDRISKVVTEITNLK